MRKEEIINILSKIEEKEGIEIIYACEAGSRVWGFANDDSDYDIRFIYRKLDVKDYLTLKRPADVIEYEGDELDIVGWDIRKALGLHLKDNPNLREWLISDVVYIDRGIGYLFDDLGEFDKRILKNHYMSIASKNWRKYYSLKFDRTKTKKYLYVIRSILCWNVLDSGDYPPVNINELLNHESNGISNDLKQDILNLIAFHQGRGEITEDIIFRLNNFILKSLNSMEKVGTDSGKDIDDYDERFREILLVC